MTRVHIAWFVGLALAAPSVALAQSPEACAALIGKTVTKSQIGIPSGDATIASAAPAIIATTMAAPEPTAAVSYTHLTLPTNREV